MILEVVSIVAGVHVVAKVGDVRRELYNSSVTVTALQLSSD